MTGLLATGLTFARNFGPHIAVIAAIAFSLGSCSAWKMTQLWYRDSIADFELELAGVRAAGQAAQARVEAIEQAGASISRGIADALDAKIAERDARRDGAVERLSRVRLCRDTGAGAVPGSTGTAGADDGAAGADELPRSVGADLGDLAIAADVNTDKLLACQAFVREALSLLRDRGAAR